MSAAPDIEINSTIGNEFNFFPPHLDLENITGLLIPVLEEAHKNLVFMAKVLENEESYKHFLFFYRVIVPVIFVFIIVVGVVGKRLVILISHDKSRKFDFSSSVQKRF